MDMQFIIDLLIANPKLAVLFTVMSVSRAIFKPLCSLINAFVDSTETATDNEKWAAIQDSKIFKSIAYAMDLFLSVKLPKKDDAPK